MICGLTDRGAKRASYAYAASAVVLLGEQRR